MARALAIDLGSSSTLVFAPGKGVILDEPTVVAMRERTGEVVAIGYRAWHEVDAAPAEVVAVRPLRQGVVVDFEVTERLLRLVLARTGGTRWGGPRVLAVVPTIATAVERRAITEAALSAGARSVDLIAAPMAGALGCGLSIDEPRGSFVLDVGGGITEAAVISMGGLVSSAAARVGGIDLDEAITRFLRDGHGLAVGERTAERLKIEAGAAYPIPDEPKAEISGRDIATGTPKTVIVGAEEIRGAIDEPVGRIIETARAALAKAPPELSHDVIDRGLLLVGGGGLLRGLDQRISAETSIPVHVAEAPASTAVAGAGAALAALDRLKEHGILLS